MIPFPIINKIFSMVMQHECQLKASILYEYKILIHIVDYHKHHGRGRGNGYSFTLGNKKICTHFKRNGHTIETCYRKHCFPSHFGKNPVVVNQFFLKSNEKLRMFVTPKVGEVMTTMDSLRNNMIVLCIYFMHQAKIIILLLESESYISYK